MRKKSKHETNSPENVEMVIKINNENIVVEVIPPYTKLHKNGDCERSPAVDIVQEQISQNHLVDDLAQEPVFDDSSLSCSSDEKSQPKSVLTEDRKLTHNKSEKLRRAQLKASMERLKLLVPLEDSTQKYTTAALLRKAKFLIHKLEEREKRNVNFKEQLYREQRFLRKKLEQIQQLPRNDGTSFGNSNFSVPVTSTSASQLISKPKVVSMTTTSTKYPLPLSTAQKTPPILKRKQNLDPDNSSTEFIYFNTPHTIETKSSVDLTMTPVTTTSASGTTTSTTYEMVTPDTIQLNPNILAENYCIIIDTGMVQEAFQPVSTMTIE